VKHTFFAPNKNQLTTEICP